MQRAVLMTAALLMAAGAGAWSREAAQERLKWEDLGSRITDKKVAFVLLDGTHVEGKVTAVEPEGLRMKVSKSSNRKVQPKGKQVVPRAAITLLRVTEYRKAGRLVGTLGAIGLSSGIVAAQQIDINEGVGVIVVPIAIAAGIAGSGVAGYYTGKAIDKRVTEIAIVR